MMFCSGDILLIIQVPCQRGCAELAHTVDLRLLSLKSVLKVIFVQRDPILTTTPNNCEFTTGPIR